MFWKEFLLWQLLEVNFYVCFVVHKNASVESGQKLIIKFSSSFFGFCSLFVVSIWLFLNFIVLIVQVCVDSLRIAFCWFEFFSQISNALSRIFFRRSVNFLYQIFVAGMIFATSGLFFDRTLFSESRDVTFDSAVADFQRFCNTRNSRLWILYKFVKNEFASLLLFRLRSR